MNGTQHRLETDYPEVRGKVVAHGRYMGIRWVITYNDLRGFEALNGYCQIPQGHPWYGKGYDDLDDVEVHGGLTYGMDEKGFVGFDTAHAGDHWSYEALAEAGIEIDVTWREEHGLSPNLWRNTEWSTGWTLGQMKSEVEQLAFQIAMNAD